jgi:hypothetical protein
MSMNCTAVALASKVALAASLCSPALAQAERVAHTYDLRAVTQPSHVNVFSARAAPLLDHDDEGGALELESDDGVGALARILSFAFESELEAPGCELRLDEEGRARIVAGSATHQRIAQSLERLGAGLTAPLTVRMDVVELPAGAAARGGLLSLADADKLLAGGARRSFTLRAPRGRVATLDASTLRQIVGGYGVEVAEQSAQFAPHTQSVSSGVRCALRAADNGNGAQLALYASISHLQPLRVRELHLGGVHGSESGAKTPSGKVELELATLLAFSGGFNVFIPKERAAVFTSSVALESGERHFAWVLRCEGHSGASVSELALGAPRPNYVHVWDTSWIEPPRARLSGTLIGRDVIAEARHLEWVHGGERALHVELAAPPLTERLARWGERASDVFTLGPYAIALSREGQRPELSESERSGGGDPSSVLLNWKLARAGAPVASGSAPLLVGEASAWMQGAEARRIHGASVEVASKVGAVCPMVSSALDGLLIRARPLTNAQGLDVEFSLDAHVQSGALSERNVGAPLALPMDQASWDVLTVRETLRARPAPYVFQGGGGLELEVTILPAL